MHDTAHKSPEAFRTISEVAEELDVPQHVLRFWESKFGAVRPLKRGGGRRYYRPDDVDLLRGIRSLLYTDGLTIKGVQKVLRERGARYVVGLGREAVSHMDYSHAEAKPSDPEIQDPAPLAYDTFSQEIPEQETPEQYSPDPGSNIHLFPQSAQSRPGGNAKPTKTGLTGSERDYFGSVLDELLDLKDRLGTARQKIGQI